MREEILRLERVCCLEQGIVQLEHFNLQVFKGEIMGVLAINSHGLDTLIRLLRCRLPIQRGYVYYREHQINPWSGHICDYKTPRIGIIENRSSLIQGMTVADNIFVLRCGFKSWLVRPALLRAQLNPVLEQLNVPISSDDYVDHLTAFECFVVEMLKAVLGGCRLIVLREVSTFISDSDLSRLHTIIRKFAQYGIAFLYIGYHYEELWEICDRTALLMNGTITKVLAQEQLPPSCKEPYQRLVEKQLGCRVQKNITEPAVFRAKHICGGMVCDLNFSVQAGKCVVLQDMNNQIFKDFLALLLGDIPVETGSFELNGSFFHPSHTRDIAILPEQAATSMLMSGLSVLDNLCFTLDHRLPELWRSRHVRHGISKECEKLLSPELFRLKPEQLSISQKYDLIYTRILLQKPKVLFCIQPFQGADMELRMNIWNHLNRLIKQGVALVILAVNLADSLSLAHQLVRIGRNTPNEYYNRNDFSQLSGAVPWGDLYQQDLTLHKEEASAL